MRSLVTGGAGFIGSSIVDELIRIGHEVIVIDNESSDTHLNFYWNDNASNYKMDITEYGQIRPLFDGVDYVFHLAAESKIQPTILNPIKAIETNTLGTAIVLQCAREASIKRVVYSSTSAGYGRNPIPNIETQTDDCLNPYSVSKISGEKICLIYSELFNLETVILRYFNVYGPRQPVSGPYSPVLSIFDRQKKNNEPLTIIGDGDQRRDFVHVTDVVNANILAATKSIPEYLFGSIFNIGSGMNYSVNEIAAVYNNKTINLPARLGEMRETLANNEKAQKILGWKPQKDLISYIHSTL